MRLSRPKLAMSSAKPNQEDLFCAGAARIAGIGRSELGCRGYLRRSLLGESAARNDNKRPRTLGHFPTCTVSVPGEFTFEVIREGLCLYRWKGMVDGRGRQRRFSQGSIHTHTHTNRDIIIHYTLYIYI